MFYWWENNNSSFHSGLFVALILFMCVSFAFESETKCETCRDIAKHFTEGLKNTVKSSFGGGNTNWEESRLGSYATSETRFVEVMEHACDESKKECHHMLEEQEEVLEDWFFKHYARGLDLDLEVYFCIDKLRVCCPEGTFGPECESCPGGTERPCWGNGDCEGSGTREGSGKCECRFGYQGTLCTECMEAFFVELRNETHTICQPCHPGCLGSCSGPDNTDCESCRDGYVHSEGEGCLDVDECSSGEHNCVHGQYCMNKAGSFHCPECDAACDGCVGPGPENCDTCAERYYSYDGVCKPCHPACAARCTDDTASTCDACNDGWRAEGFGFMSQSCRDIDECEEGLRTCDRQSFCENSEGSSTCVACHQSCSGCTGPTAADCTVCQTGYAVDENTNECTDVDECADGSSQCALATEKCVNTVGSYRCVCAEGFQRRSGKCEAKKKPSKKKTKESSDVDTAGSDHSSPSLTEGLGEPLKGRPLADEMIVMQGSSDIPADTGDVQSVENDGTDGSKTARQDL